MTWAETVCKNSMFSRVYKKKFIYGLKSIYQIVKSLLVMRIDTNLTGYQVDSMVNSWLLRLLRICSSRSVLRGQVTDGKKHFIPPVSFFWLVGLGTD